MVGVVSPFLRKVRTSSGARAVQIVSKSGGVRRIVEPLGSAHDEAEVEVLHGPTYLGLGDAAGGDRAFEQMGLARLIEPTSKA